MSGSAFAVTHHAFSSGAGRTSDGNGSHASTLKSPSYTKSVSWQHYPKTVGINNVSLGPIDYSSSVLGYPVKLDVVEYIVYDKALSGIEMLSVYIRSKKRLASRGIKIE
ncbi:hypothetical protein [Raoultella terrigena]|uniref:hypothetical protein n=1 Tax=Raoultella terrigena TaxID=577 RepID=UPI00155B33F1|nr:hypothetical protein [Raoultella terrigena]